MVKPPQITSAAVGGKPAQHHPPPAPSDAEAPHGEVRLHVRPVRRVRGRPPDRRPGTRAADVRHLRRSGDASVRPACPHLSPLRPATGTRHRRGQRTRAGGTAQPARATPSPCSPTESPARPPPQTVTDRQGTTDARSALQRRPVPVVLRPGSPAAQPLAPRHPAGGDRPARRRVPPRMPRVVRRHGPQRRLRQRHPRPRPLDRPPAERTGRRRGRAAR